MKKKTVRRRVNRRGKERGKEDSGVWGADMKEVKTSDAKCQSFYALLGWRTVLSSCESARILGSRLCHSFTLVPFVVHAKSPLCGTKGMERSHSGKEHAAIGFQLSTDTRNAGFGEGKNRLRLYQCRYEAQTNVVRLQRSDERQPEERSRDTVGERYASRQQGTCTLAYIQSDPCSRYRTSLRRTTGKLSEKAIGTLPMKATGRPSVRQAALAGKNDTTHGHAHEEASSRT
ncbi:hypothetical protein L1887_54445 [Cichorium endivia]|nr:hypothetical protein L1887_54445 [Cichorium endivia]